MYLRRRLEYLLKHNLVIQLMYRIILSFLLYIIGLFVKQDDRLILFSSFGGKKFNDSPKVLFEAMQHDRRFSNYRYIWAFEQPSRFSINGAESIKIDSIRYFFTALKAKVWITSVNIERGLHFKKKGTIYINTWHGAGTKKIGNACSNRKDYNFSNVDMMLVQSDFEREIFIRDFLCKPSSIRKIGFPRNDDLFHFPISEIDKIKENLKISNSKKVILYAPTWRDSQDGGIAYKFSPPIHSDKWRNRLSDDYVFLYRMHTFTTEFKFPSDDFFRDVSSYDNLNQILAISDIVVTDYSTIIYDCSVAKKPFICFGFDYDMYNKQRGFYFDLNRVYPGGVISNEDDVLRRIDELSNGVDEELFDNFRRKYIESGGNSTNEVLEELFKFLILG